MKQSLEKISIPIIANVGTVEKILDELAVGLSCFKSGQLSEKDIDNYMFLANFAAFAGLIPFRDYLYCVKKFQPKAFALVHKNGLDVPFINCYEA